MQLPNLKEARKRTKTEVEIIRYNKEDKYKNIVKNKYYFVKTYGCQMNEHDSENIIAMLEYMGYKNTDKLEKSDIVILNTCSIRENANNKVFGFLGRVKHIKNIKKDLIVGITGCMTQEEVITNKLLEKYKWINFVVGTHMLDKLCEEVYKSINDSRLDIVAPSIEGNIIEDLPVKRESKYKAYINIQLGCDKFCTYCIVPYTRGKQRSRRKEDILNEVNTLKNEGYKEITLLGQNVNSYLRVEREKGIEFEEYEGVNSFATLLRAVNKIDGIERIRFVSPHPKDFTDDVIKAIADCEKVCKLVHLPLQSGNTKVLKEMNRKYTKEQYLNLVEKMKAGIPGLTLSTDIIVGFPGETDEEFEDTLDVVEKVKFEQVYMFIYSRRVGTPGNRMENQVPEEQKHIRFDKLKALVESQIAENNQKYVGTIQKVLVEGTSKNNDDMLTGRTDSNKVVIFEGDKNLIGKMAEIKIVSEHMWYLKGEK